MRMGNKRWVLDQKTDQKCGQTSCVLATVQCAILINLPTSCLTVEKTREGFLSPLSWDLKSNMGCECRMNVNQIDYYEALNSKKQK